MRTVNLQQGTKLWHEHRAIHFNASDASAIKGASPYRKRADLVRQAATGIAPEIDASTQRIFDKGHAAEASARPIVENRVGEELFPCVGVSDENGKLSASFDGMSMDGSIIWEHKLWSESKASDVRNGHIPDCDWWQAVQQLFVSGAERLLYTVSDGTEEKMVELWVDGGQARKCAGALVTAWEQLEKDVAAYKPEPEAAPVNTGVTPETLPALHVEATGKVIASNLDAYRDHAMAVLGAINRNLKTDEDFADADATVKWCRGVESKLSAAKDSVLGQMATVDEVCRTIDDLSAETRRVRLDLDKLVKAEKDARKTAIVNAAVESVREHYAGMSASLGEHVIGLPATLRSDIGAAIKGLKTLSSITDAADTAAANIKIEASQQADRIRAAVAVLDEFADHRHLFADRVQLCQGKTPEDLRNLAKARVADHEERERQRIEAERERIRVEEQAKAERKAQLLAEAAEAERADIARAKAEHEAQANEKPDAPAPAPQMQPVDRVPPATDAEWMECPAEASNKPAPVDALADGNRLIKLGDIQRAISPLSITADGMYELAGVEPQDVPGRAKMYHINDALAAINAMRGAMERAIHIINESAKEAA